MLVSIANISYTLRGILFTHLNLDCLVATIFLAKNIERQNDCHHIQQLQEYQLDCLFDNRFERPLCLSHTSLSGTSDGQKARLAIVHQVVIPNKIIKQPLRKNISNLVQNLVYL